MRHLYDSIARRKSCRKYDMQPLPSETIDQILVALEGFEPLYPDMPLSHRLVSTVKGHFSIQAPHYLVISGQGREGELENAGFLYEQFVLWLDTQALGSVWLGASKDIDATPHDIIVIAFGRPEEPVHREPSAFQRKPIEKITNAPEDPCIQAVHLAPSGMNAQPWYLEKNAEAVTLYKQHLKPPLSMLYNLVDLDLGIALCHYALAAKNLGKAFSFQREKQTSEGKQTPFGIIR